MGLSKQTLFDPCFVSGMEVLNQTYVLYGKNVVHLTQGSNNLHFFYAADGSPAIVEYNGVSYGYVKNLQGDVIGIVNASGAYVVQYAYDA